MFRLLVRNCRLLSIAHFISELNENDREVVRGLTVFFLRFVSIILSFVVTVDVTRSLLSLDMYSWGHVWRT